MESIDLTPQQQKSERMKLTLLISQLKAKMDKKKMGDLAELALRLSGDKRPEIIAHELNRRLKLSENQEIVLKEFIIEAKEKKDHFLDEQKIKF